MDKRFKNINFRSEENTSKWENIELLHRTNNRQYINIKYYNFENSILPKYLNHISFTDCNFRNASLEETHEFHNGALTGCDFTNANMMQIYIDQSDMIDCEFTRTNLKDCTLSRLVYIINCCFTDTTFKNGCIDNTIWDKNDFINVDFSLVRFGSVEINNGNKITGCNFNGAKFNELRIKSFFTTIKLLNSTFNNTEILNYNGSSFGKIIIESKGGKIINHDCDNNWILTEL